MLSLTVLSDHSDGVRQESNTVHRTVGKMAPSAVHGEWRDTAGRQAGL